jgi:hypothetical protein
VTRLLDGRHHLERFAMEQAGEVDYLITALRALLGAAELIGLSSSHARCGSGFWKARIGPEGLLRVVVTDSRRAD